MTQSDIKIVPGLFPIRILVVEDEPLLRFTMAEALRELGASVAEAATADEAWEYLKSGADADLVFTDHKMPGSMTGAQLAARIKNQYPAIEVVVTSAAFDGTEWSARVLAKPYDLFETAEDLIDRATRNRAK